MSKFNELINGSTPVLVDFYADWCAPCKAMTPILKELASKMKEKIKIIKVDVDKNPHVAEKFQVLGVPTLILFKKGKILWQQSGLLSLDNLLQIINNLINKSM